MGSCHASGTEGVAAKECLGKATCSLPANNATFGDPCYGKVKQLALAVSCAPTSDQERLRSRAEAQAREAQDETRRKLLRAKVDQKLAAAGVTGEVGKRADKTAPPHCGVHEAATVSATPVRATYFGFLEYGVTARAQGSPITPTEGINVCASVFSQGRRLGIHEFTLNPGESKSASGTIFGNEATAGATLEIKYAVTTRRTEGNKCPSMCDHPE